MHSIFQKVTQHKKQNLPFVIYRKPNAKTIVGVFQEDDHLYFSNSLSEKGFVFAPFEGSPIIFPFEKAEVNYNTVYFEHELDTNFKEFDSSIEKKSVFENLVQRGIEEINRGTFSKVVLSRTESVVIDHFDLETAFEKMLQHYPTAFCYCWYHPKIGMWMGATPEKLLNAKESKFNSMALAGTQMFQDIEPIVWQNKERVEQEFVTQFILENLKVEATEINVSSPYTTRAGSLLHLRTDIEGTLNSDSNLKKVVDILHPTPAVCGLPKILAKDFILENEGYNREFYTGFLGEINHDFNSNDNATDLYVNLRCMKVTDKFAQLFIGCGITKDSNPEAEWNETVNKSITMKRIL